MARWPHKRVEVIPLPWGGDPAGGDPAVGVPAAGVPVVGDPAVGVPAVKDPEPKPRKHKKHDRKHKTRNAVVATSTQSLAGDGAPWASSWASSWRSVAALHLALWRTLTPGFAVGIGGAPGIAGLRPDATGDTAPPAATAQDAPASRPGPSRRPAAVAGASSHG
jgi:hypothetical protein